jgi:hypothetical protein
VKWIRRFFMNTSTSSRFNVFTVEEFDAPTPEDQNRKAKTWTKVGVAFPHREGTGYNIQLRALPVDGRLVVLPANTGEETQPAAASPVTAPSAKEVRAARR